MTDLITPKATARCPWIYRFWGGCGGLQPGTRCNLEENHEGPHELRRWGEGRVFIGRNLAEDLDRESVVAGRP